MFEELAAESTLKFVATARKIAGTVKANLGLGEPDFRPPKELVEELVRATQVKPTYTPSAGLPELRRVLAEWFSARYNADVSPDEVMVTPSGKAALYLALLYASSKFKRGVVHDPYYYSYEPVLKSAGVVVERVPMVRSGEGYAFPDLSKLVKDNIIVLNTPSNPTGSVYGKAIYDLAERVREDGGLVVSDEVYDVFDYEGKHVSILQVPEWRDVGMFIYSFSKVLCVPGWRIGVIVARAEIVRKLAAAASNVYGCPCKWEQIALTRFLENYDDVLLKHVEAMRSEYNKRRLRLIDKLRSADVFPGIGEGAFYAFPDFGVDSEKLALEAAKRKVIAIPGTIFSERYGRRSLRISYSAPPDELEYGLNVLLELAEELKNKTE